MDGDEHAVVGVMPPGFALPMSEELWTALQTSPAPGASADGQELFVFGRLAPGVTRQQAQAELTAIGFGGPDPAPQAAARLRPRVLPYSYPLDHVDSHTLWEATQLQLMVSLLLLAITVNVAVLVYARTAMRRGEIAMRAALGASRRRIVTQLFVEAFLFSILGAGLGLALAHAGLRQTRLVFDGMGDAFGFWVDWSVQPLSIAFAVALAVLSAVIIGVLPALKSTGRSLDADLRRIGGGTSVRLGRAWTALIVAQVAVAVTVLPMALRLGFQEMRFGAIRSTLPAHELLGAGLELAVPLRPGMDGVEYRREAEIRLGDRLPELERRLEAEPAVAGVTFEGRLPGRGRVVQVEDVSGPAELRGHRVSSAGVATDYFEVVGARILAGRDLRASDAERSTGGVVVSEAFARQVLGGGPAVGRRIRFMPPAERGHTPEQEVPGPWLEIVGVVQDLEASAFDRELAPPFAYYAIEAGDIPGAYLLVRVHAGDTDGFAPALRRITTTLDPALRLTFVSNFATTQNPRYLAVAVAALLLVLSTVLLLSAAGVHALMSLTVTRRRREIGVRAALGARPARLLANIFSRAAWQLGLGGLLGCVLGGALLLGDGLAPWRAAVFVGGVALLMLTAGLLAAAGPARRGLGVQPMEALREE